MKMITKLPEMNKVHCDKKSDLNCECQDFEDHTEFIDRVAKTFYYGNTSPADCLSFPLIELAAELYSEVRNDSSLDKLRLEEATEIAKNTCVSTCSLVLAILYLERIKNSNPEYIDKVAPSELFLVSLMVASKFLTDDSKEEFVLNSDWASSAHITLEQMNAIEKDFLDAINWQVFITQDDFWMRLRKLEWHLAKKQAIRRGWFSYTELHTLLQLHTLISVRKMMMVSAACLICYATTVASLVGLGVLANSITTLAVENLLNVKDALVFIDTYVTQQLDEPTDVNEIELAIQNERAVNSTKNIDERNSIRNIRRFIATNDYDYNNKNDCKIVAAICTNRLKCINFIQAI